MVDGIKADKVWFLLSSSHNPDILHVLFVYIIFFYIYFFFNLKIVLHKIYRKWNYGYVNGNLGISYNLCQRPLGFQACTSSSKKAGSLGGRNGNTVNSTELSSNCMCLAPTPHSPNSFYNRLLSERKSYGHGTSCLSVTNISILRGWVRTDKNQHVCKVCN